MSKTPKSEDLAGPPARQIAQEIANLVAELGCDSTVTVVERPFTSPTGGPDDIDLEIVSDREDTTPMTVHVESSRMFYLAVGESGILEFFADDGHKFEQNLQHAVSIIRLIMLNGMTEERHVGLTRVVSTSYVEAADNKTTISRASSWKGADEAGTKVMKYRPYV